MPHPENLHRLRPEEIAPLVQSDTISRLNGGSGEPRVTDDLLIAALLGMIEEQDELIIDTVPIEDIHRRIDAILRENAGVRVGTLPLPLKPIHYVESFEDKR